MWAVSLYTKTEWCTLVYSVAILVYNEGGLVRYCVLKNILGAIGLACYCWGTTVILGRSSSAKSWIEDGLTSYAPRL